VASVGDAVSCSSLMNRITHFTVRIEVGTPPQAFDVVADTGSDSVIVTSCACRDTKHCDPSNKCFRGQNVSSTFLMHTVYDPNSASPQVPVVVMSFGSGQIEAVVASDLVRVGRVDANMSEGLLLMVDQALRMAGPFEGILGLGMPRKQAAPTPEPAPTPQPNATAGQAVSTTFLPHGFLQTAGITRFSMCFNEGEDGVLRLGVPEDPAALGSIGEAHWGLDFRGISVGDFSAPVQFCTDDSMKPGQATPCGAIPDSGTTVMMAPADHIKLLLEQLCDRWDRCREEVPRSNKPKHELFQMILMACETWLTEAEGLDSLPELHFHLRGADGRNKTLSLAGASYVMETYQEEMHHVTKHLDGIFPTDEEADVPTGRQMKVCVPAFGTHDFTTAKNGPVWILGTPIFYEFQVAYNMETKPPSISFSEAPCGACVSRTSLFLAGEGEGVRMARRARRARMPRQTYGPLRLPSMGTSGPL